MTVKEDPHTESRLKDMSQLSPERRALLALYALRLKQKSKDAEGRQSVPKLTREEGINFFPLSFAQSRLWLLDRIAPGSNAYNLPVAIRLTGRLNVPALEQSLNEIVRRHEVLRTTFTFRDDEPQQVIAPESSLKLRLVDLSEMPRAVRDREAERQANEVARAPFDLSQGPLLRATLLCLDDQEHAVILTMHHIISDAWSTGILIREFTALYEAFDAGHASPLPLLPIQYADFAVWQREWLQGKTLQQHLEYWKRQLADLPPALELPADRPYSAASSTRGASYRYTLPKPLLESLKELSSREGVSLFMLLLAAFKTLLRRYTGQNDILVGTPIAGRNRTEIEGLVGFFINTLMLRTDLSGNPTFRELLGRVREVSLGAFANENLPFERLVEEIQPERRVGGNPFSQIMFVLQNAPVEHLKLRGLTLSPFQTFGKAETTDDLLLTMAETEQGLFSVFEYKADLFGEATVARVAGHFHTLLRGIVADPARRIADLPLLTEGEYRQLIVEWNDTAFNGERKGCVHHLFEEQAARTPESIAVVWDDEQLSYAELDERANRLANHLRSLGVRAESVVGISVERGPEMVVGVLGILKAGGAYLPLDPHYPRDRVAFMLEDARVGVLLTQQQLLESLPAHKAHVICLDAGWDAVAAEEAANPRSEVWADSPAYVIYTSGSTGRPKGVQMTHRPLVNLLTWQCQDLPDRETARTLQFASLSFDMSFQEMFMTWMTGACLVLMKEEVRRDGMALLGVMRRHGVTRLLIPFVGLQQLAEAVEESGELPERLREVISAGEQLRITPAISALFRELKGCRLYNQYGPSEVHAVTSVWLGERQEEWPKLPPIGRPIWNTQVYVLDKQMRPVPVGVAGEIYIGGECVSRGFLGRPDMTAEKYVPDPYGPHTGGRLYRSGDVGRLTAAGLIEVVGRIDQQVKIRGYRIELGEVETVLDAHEAVGKCVVVVREDAPGVKRLVGYVVAAPGKQPPTPSELRHHMRASLPDYMVPTAFVSMDALPLTPSGKINRRALPAPDAERPQLDNAPTAPRTQAEKALAEIWAEVLGIENVGIHDNFLELGGDSILSIQIVSRAKRVGLHITVTQLWEQQTIAELAAADKALPTAAAERPPRVADVWGEPSGQHGTVDEARAALQGLSESGGQIEDVYPLSPMQQGILFHSLYQRTVGEYVEQFSCDLRGGLNVFAFKAAWEQVVARHPALRTTFVWEGFDEPLQVVHPTFSLPFEQHDWRGLSADEQRECFATFIEAERRDGTFDFARAPLIRIFLFRLSDDAYRFVWSLHDIVIDGWSAPLILGEVSRCYEAHREGREPRLEASYPYRDFIEWLRLQDLTSAGSFWQRMLEGFTTPTRLPFDRGGGYGSPVPVGNYAQQRVSLSDSTTAALQSATRKHQLTLNTLMQGAWALLLSRFSGEDDVLFGSVVSGRPPELAGVEAVVGVFVNTLPVRVRVSGLSPLERWLKEIQTQQIDARRYEYTPLVQIHKWSEIPAGRRLFDSILAFVNYPDSNQSFWGEGDWHLQKSGYPLFIVVRPGAEMLLEITYDADLFDDETIKRMMSYFQTLLEAIPADLSQPLSALPALSKDERRLLLAEWNNTSRDFPLRECFQQHFERQVEKSPEALAVVFEDERLTYAELNRRANRLARSLVRRGVGPDTLVALLAARGAEFWVAVLAVFKSGAAYLPLDPLYPPQRLRQVLEQSGALAVLTTDDFVPLLAESLDGSPVEKRLPILQIGELTRQESNDANLPPRAAPENLVYVIYTSGSTGKPKGVMVEHRGMLNHLYAKITDLRLSAADTVAQTASQCFDISVWQYLSALLVGGCVHIYDDEVAHHPARLLERADADGITVLETIPSLMRLMLEEIDRRQAARPALEALRWLIPTGEALPRELCRRWLSAYPHIPLVNAYGPTECSDDVTHHLLREPPASGVSSVPIGRPVSNMRLYVLDSCGQPTPVKIAGELCIGGVGVGRGYLDDPKRTAEVFIPDPFGATPGARLYRTGDLGRYLPGGEIEFLGRLDHQVKVRGFRIELGEIEAALERQAAVRSCAVVVRGDAEVGQQLVAYVVPRSGQVINADALRRDLKESLPHYMIPTAFVVLEALPLTPNGKIDHKALPAPEQVAAAPEQAGDALQTPTELALGKIWTEVLKVERLGAHDNFFTMGGHSLLAIQVISRAQTVFGIEVPPRALFDGPTIVEMAATIEEMLLVEMGGIK